LHKTTTDTKHTTRKQSMFSILALFVASSLAIQIVNVNFNNVTFVSKTVLTLQGKSYIISFLSSCFSQPKNRILFLCALKINNFSCRKSIVGSSNLQFGKTGLGFVEGIDFARRSTSSLRALVSFLPSILCVVLLITFLKNRFPYPKVAVAELDPPSYRHKKSFWNFHDISPQLDNFINSTEAPVINFSTQPAWFYNGSWSYPKDPNEVDWSYCSGEIAYSNTTSHLAGYYGRLLSWLVKGHVRQIVALFQTLNSVVLYSSLMSLVIITMEDLRWVQNSLIGRFSTRSSLNTPFRRKPTTTNTTPSPQPFVVKQIHKFENPPKSVFF
jgi:hypothetical protein